MKGSLISITDLSKEEILRLLKSAEEMKKKKPKALLEGCIVASCFFEPSTRTRLSFEAAALRLGGNVIGFSDLSATSMKKGESLKDSMRVIGGYADIIVLRHPMEGAARLADEVTDCPVINAGDGANQHPTQTLTDLFTMKECQKKLNGLRIAMVGDLKYGRTIHSLALTAGFFNFRLYLISPDSLALPDTICHELRKRGVKFSFHRTIEEIVDKVDILYMTRIQKERFETDTYDKVKDLYILKYEMLKKAPKHLKILHPLPRVNEIDTAIDETEHAYYFEQAENGLFVREALLSSMWKRGKS